MYQTQTHIIMPVFKYLTVTNKCKYITMTQNGHKLYVELHENDQTYLSNIFYKISNLSMIIPMKIGIEICTINHISADGKECILNLPMEVIYLKSDKVYVFAPTIKNVEREDDNFKITLDIKPMLKEFLKVYDRYFEN